MIGKHLSAVCAPMTLYFLLMFLCGSVDPATDLRDSVVVTGVYEPVPTTEVDRAVQVIDLPQRLPFLGAAGDLLRLDSSVDLRQRAPAGAQADLSIRGGTFGQSLVLLDGLRLNDAQTGHHNLDLPVPVEAVSRVEVLHGSGSTLYGSDAIGGAVNLITSAPEHSLLRVGAAAGNMGVNQQRVAFAAVRRRWAQQFWASRDFSSGFLPNRDFRNLVLSSESQAKSALGLTTLTLGQSDRPFGADMFYGNYHSWERTRTWFASLRQQLGGKTEAALAFRRHTDLFVLQRDRPEAYTNRHAVRSYQASVRRREDVARNTGIHFGAEVTADSIASNNLGRHSRTGGAVYAALDFRALGRFSFSAGLREQLYAGRHGVLSPSLAGGVWLSPHWKLNGSASHAFRLPSYTDLYYHDPATVGSPSLRPERAWSYDSGLEWHPGARVLARLGGFHRRESDGIDYVRTTPADVWRAVNIQRLRFTGVEAAFQARLSAGHRLEMRYTALHGASEALGGMLSRYVFNFPSHNAVATWDARLPGGVAARLEGGTAKRTGRALVCLLDLHISATERRLRPFLHLTNAANVSYQEVSGVPMPGRGIVAGVEWLVAGPRD